MSGKEPAEPTTVTQYAYRLDMAILKPRTQRVIRSRPTLYPKSLAVRFKSGALDSKPIQEGESWMAVGKHSEFHLL
jgi:hypothetical protein